MSALIFDTETTQVKEPEVIEAAYLLMGNPIDLNFLSSFTSRYRPVKPISLGAMAIHHIIDEDLIDCLPSESFKLPEDTEYLIGHNIDFDWKAIGKPQVKRICTLALARKAWPDLDSHNLSALVYYIDKSTAKDKLKNAHSALADANMCYYVLTSLLYKFSHDTWEALWLESEAARVPVIMPFGMHKGLLITDVPSQYKNWLLKQDDVDEYLRIALKS